MGANVHVARGPAWQIALHYKQLRTQEGGRLGGGGDRRSAALESRRFKSRCCRGQSVTGDRLRSPSNTNGCDRGAREDRNGRATWSSWQNSQRTNWLLLRWRPASDLCPPCPASLLDLSPSEICHPSSHPFLFDRCQYSTFPKRKSNSNCLTLHFKTGVDGSLGVMQAGATRRCACPSGGRFWFLGRCGLHA